MRPKYLFALLLGLLGLCLYLFHLIYADARAKAISEVNARQLLHAQQARKGIEYLFNRATSLLTNLAASEDIIALSDQGKKQLAFVLANNSFEITALSRIDSFGRIAHTAPDSPDSIGRDISGQKHVQTILATRRLVVSDVFTAVQGYPAIAMHVPVFRQGVFDGTLGALIDFQAIAKRFLQDIRIGETGYAWMTSKEGIELYCPVPGHTGRSVFENCKEFPTIIAMAKEMVWGRQGLTTYYFNRVGDQRRETVKKHAVYLPIRIGDTFWSIVVASSEDEVLASLVRFRDKLILVMALLLLGSALFSYHGMKAWGIVREAEKRREAEAALRQSEVRFRELFDNMGAGVAIYASPDNGQRFVFKDLNKHGLESAKKNKAQVIGREVREVFPGVEALGLFEVFQRVWETGRPEHYPSRMYKDDKIVLWVENYVCKLPSGELVAIYQDTTATKQAEDAREKLEGQLFQIQKMESIGTLAGGIAHDFNNMLFPIIGLSELLLEDLPEGSAERAKVEDIFKAAQRAGELVKQILAFSRQSDNKKMPVRIQAVLKEALALTRATIPANIPITTDIQTDCRPVMADPTQLHQIAMNLITNAFHAVESSGGEISVRLQETDVADDGHDTPLMPGAYAVLTVADKGPGIDPAVRPRIFEPYFTTKPKGKGTGLGLSVVLGIVKELGGDVRVASERGRGAMFSVYLPLLKDASPPICPQRAMDFSKGTERVLLIDDEEPIVRIEKQMLERLGYRVAVRTSSVDAVEDFKADPTAVDVVITDMTMPNMTGDRLAKAMIAIRPDIPIIICTGFSEMLDAQRAKAMGIKGFLMKPVVLGELAAMLREVLDPDGTG